MGLTEEQKERMEQKKAEALAKIKNRHPPGGGGGSCSGQSLAARLNMAASQARQLVSKTPLAPSTNTISSTISPALSMEQKQLMEAKRRAAMEKRSSPSKTISSTTVTLKQMDRFAERRKDATEKRTNFGVTDAAVGHKSATTFYGKTVKGHCTLLTRSRFQVTVGFHQQIVQTFKTLETAQYNAKDKVWTFHVREHDALIRQTNGLKPEVEITPLPHWVVHTFNRPERSIEDEELETIDLSTVEPSLLGQLMPFQRLGIQYGVSRGGRVLIADDMGLGKTVQALGLASYYRAAWPVLVVAPSSMRFAWREAVERWLPSVPPQEVSVLTSGKDFVGNSLITVISYDLLSRKSEELKRKNFQLVIMDESHMIKDHKSARTKAAEPLMRAARYLIMLSGTPALSRPIELYSQLSALQPTLFRFPTEYGNRYCDGKMVRLGPKEVPDFSGSSNMTELSLLLSERCMIRRLKTEVLKQLPSKQRCMVVLNPGMVDTNSKAMQQRRNEAVKEEIKGMEKRGLILEFFNETATAKLKAVQEYVKDLMSGDKKVLVFCHHLSMMDGVGTTLDKLKVGYIRIDGSVGSEKRKLLVDKFQTNDKTQVALLSITAANSGITLTAAQLVVFAELFWNPGVLTQAEDRAHRIGQTECVVIQYLVARGTADDFIWPMIQGKLDVLNKAGLSKDNFGESEAKVMEDTTQSKIEDFYKASEKGCDDGGLGAIIWGELTEDDFDFESSPKRLKPDYL